jgi:hypothetical protein
MTSGFLQLESTIQRTRMTESVGNNENLNDFGTTVI